jgi:hypothetical protein
MNINKVTITVEMGNDAMQTETDLADALRKLAKRIETSGLARITKVMDENGNNVGKVDVE